MQRMGVSPAATFHSAENKAVLWAALRDAGAFDDMPPGTERQVMSSIETRMGQAAAGSHPADGNLTQLNKTVLRGVLADLGKTRMPVQGTRGDPRVAQAFASKRAEIDAMAQGDKPHRIDFSDKVDTPMGAEMERAIQEAVNLRTAQANASQVQHEGTRREAEGWLGVKAKRGGAAPPSMQLKIGESVPGPSVAEVPAVSVPKRQVRFNAEVGEVPPIASRAPPPSGTTSAHGFLSALKRDDNAAPQTLSSIDDSLKRLAAAVERLGHVVEQASASMAPAPAPPSPLSSAGSGPAEIDLSSDKDGQDD